MELMKLVKEKDNHEIVVKIDPGLFRPAEVDTLLGDSQKARERLGWEPIINLEQLNKEMIDCDLREAKKESLLKKEGFTINNSLEDFTK